MDNTHMLYTDMCVNNVNIKKHVLEIGLKSAVRSTKNIVAGY